MSCKAKDASDGVIMFERGVWRSRSTDNRFHHAQASSPKRTEITRISYHMACTNFVRVCNRTIRYCTLYNNSVQLLLIIFVKLVVMQPNHHDPLWQLPLWTSQWHGDSGAKKPTTTIVIFLRNKTMQSDQQIAIAAIRWFDNKLLR